MPHFKTESIEIKEMKTGDLILFYNHVFEIISDSFEILPDRPGVFVAKCQHMPNLSPEIKSDLDKCLERYHGFQGNSNVKHQRIII